MRMEISADDLVTILILKNTSDLHIDRHNKHSAIYCAVPGSRGNTTESVPVQFSSVHVQGEQTTQRNKDESHNSL